MYRSELRDYPHPRSLEGIRITAKLGIQKWSSVCGGISDSSRNQRMTIKSNGEIMEILIDNFRIGVGSPTFIVAELSCNHLGDKDMAIETIRAAKTCGADAIKLQTYSPDTMTIDSDKDWFKINNGSLWDGYTYYNLYKEAQTPWEWHDELFEAAREEGLVCFSSPFDASSVDFLQQFNPPAYKIASFEIVDTELVKKVASLQKPVIMSTGIAKLDEIERAISICRAQGNDQIIY